MCDHRNYKQTKDERVCKTSGCRGMEDWFWGKRFDVG